MAKARIQMMPWNIKDVRVEIPAYWCPVCHHPHSIPTKDTKNAPVGWKDRWTFNGSMDKPTFHPSVRTYYTRPGGRYWLLKRNGVFYCLPDGTKVEFGSLDAAFTYAADHTKDNGGMGWGAVQRERGDKLQVTVCHVHVTNGNIQVLPDTPGPLAGKTLPLEEWDVDEYMNPKRSEEH